MRHGPRTDATVRPSAASATILQELTRPSWEPGHRFSREPGRGIRPWLFLASPQGMPARNNASVEHRLLATEVRSQSGARSPEIVGAEKTGLEGDRRLAVRNRGRCRQGCPTHQGFSSTSAENRPRFFTALFQARSLFVIRCVERNASRCWNWLCRGGGAEQADGAAGRVRPLAAIGETNVASMSKGHRSWPAPSPKVVGRCGYLCSWLLAQSRPAHKT